jgi:hypothetical protein
MRTQVNAASFNAVSRNLPTGNDRSHEKLVIITDRNLNTGRQNEN